MSLEIVSTNSLMPAMLSDAQYEEIEALFASGMSRAEVINYFGWKKTSYYTRLKRDMRLNAAEKAGVDLWMMSSRNEIAAALSKSATGHTVTLKETVYEVVVDENTNEEVLRRKGVREFEKYVPPQSAVVNLLAKNLASGLVEESSENAMDDLVRNLTDEEQEIYFEISKKILKNG